MSVQTTLFGTMLQEKVGTIYDRPTTKYEQFIELYYSRHKGGYGLNVFVAKTGHMLGVYLKSIPSTMLTQTFPVLFA